MLLLQTQIQRMENDTDIRLTNEEKKTDQGSSGNTLLYQLQQPLNRHWSHFNILHLGLHQYFIAGKEYIKIKSPCKCEIKCPPPFGFL